MKRTLLLIACAALIMTSAGCASIGARLGEDYNNSSKLSAYPGVIDDASVIIHDPALAPVCLVDLPPSAALDTAFLPGDIIIYFLTRHEHFTDTSRR